MGCFDLDGDKLSDEFVSRRDIPSHVSLSMWGDIWTLFEQGTHKNGGINCMTSNETAFLNNSVASRIATFSFCSTSTLLAMLRFCIVLYRRTSIWALIMCRVKTHDLEDESKSLEVNEWERS